MKYFYSVLLICVLSVAVINCQDEATTESTKEVVEQVVSALPKDLKPCGRNDPKRDECLKEGFQKILQKGKEGYPELGLPPMDPLDISNTTFSVKEKEAEGNLDIKTGQITGLGQTTVKEVKSKIQDNNVEMMVQILFPELFIEATFKGYAVVNKQKFTPLGAMNATLTNVDMIWKIKGEIIDGPDGKKYINATSFDMIPEIEDFKINASGLVPDPVMNQMIVNLLNQNWRTQYGKSVRESKPEWEPNMLRSLNKFFAVMPYDKLFPEN